MIRIARPAEPTELRVARHRRLAHAALCVEEGAPVVFKGYDCARDPLYAAQGRKCAYCERQQGLEGQPVEHFRPKNGTEDGGPRHYYWLAWTWENLLFACTTCNSQAVKGNKFPLALGAIPLPEPSISEVLAGDGPAFQLEAEAAVLLDPAREDPMDHIAWRPENPEAPPDAMRWRPMFKSNRGEQTIAVFHMRGGLADHVGNHIHRNVWPGVMRLHAGITADDRTRVRSEWRGLLQILFSELQPYQAASYDALTFWLPAALRSHWGLDLPRPGREPRASVSYEIADHAKLARMPDRVRLEIRAGRLNADRLIHLLCREAAWSELELAEATGLALATVQAARRKLVGDGILRVSGTMYVATTPDRPQGNP